MALVMAARIRAEASNLNHVADAEGQKAGLIFTRGIIMLTTQRKILARTREINQKEARGLQYSHAPGCPLAEDIEHLEARGFIRFDAAGKVWITEEGLGALADAEEEDSGPDFSDMNDGLGPLPLGMR